LAKIVILHQDKELLTGLAKHPDVFDEAGHDGQLHRITACASSNLKKDGLLGSTTKPTF